MKTIAASYSVITILKDIQVSSYIYKLTPYIATLVVLAFSSKNSQAPKASGIPYDKGTR
jgi:simple sugar transport system permease protein